DARGSFWHEGAKVEHAGMAAALRSWITRHPDDGRYILTNGYDWTYFTVDDAPFFVQSLRFDPEAIVLVLSDGGAEPWEPETTRTGHDGGLYTVVKRATRGGPYEAKFTRHAQSSLARVLIDESGDEAGGRESAITVRVAGRARRVGSL
ncbi:MAG: hypothetical protein ACREJ3_07465, partial [Polyangiaceae bacterium]